MTKELYHGTEVLFDEFSNDKLCTNCSIDQYGSGFYFYGNEANTIRHGNIIVTADVEINKILESEETYKHHLTFDEAETLILKSPDLDNKLTNHGDIDYEGFDNVLRNAVKLYCDQDILHSLNTIGNDFFEREEIHILLKAFTELTGYDCIGNKKRDIYVVLSKDQIDIKSITNHFD